MGTTTEQPKTSLLESAIIILAQTVHEKSTISKDIAQAIEEVKRAKVSQTTEDRIMLSYPNLVFEAFDMNSPTARDAFETSVKALQQGVGLVAYIPYIIDKGEQNKVAWYFARL